MKYTYVKPPQGDTQEASRIAAALLDAADSPRQVQVDTSAGITFVVPREVAARANINQPQEDKTSDENTAGQDETPKKKTRRKGAS